MNLAELLEDWNGAMGWADGDPSWTLVVLNRVTDQPLESEQAWEVAPVVGLEVVDDILYLDTVLEEGTQQTVGDVLDAASEFLMPLDSVRVFTRGEWVPIPDQPGYSAQMCRAAIASMVNPDARGFGVISHYENFDAELNADPGA